MENVQPICLSLGGKIYQANENGVIDIDEPNLKCKMKVLNEVDKSKEITIDELNSKCNLFERILYNLIRKLKKIEYEFNKSNGKTN